MRKAGSGFCFHCLICVIVVYLHEPALQLASLIDVLLNFVRYHVPGVKRDGK